MDHSVTETTMLGERRGRGERLLAVGTSDALPTVGVHALVSAEVRELRVSLVADVALERLDAAVNVLVLFQSARRRERLAAAGTLMLTKTRHPGVTVRRSYLPLYAALVVVRAITVEKLMMLLFAWICAAYVALLHRNMNYTSLAETFLLCNYNSYI